MSLSRDATVLALSYALGCCTAGYYWTRLRTGKDIRILGSGNVGAANVGRCVGPAAAAVTFVADFSKGAIAVWMASRLHASPSVVAGSMSAVVVGHIWPVQLGFRGGKGVATSLGALLVLAPLVLAAISCIFLAMFLVSRRYLLSGMVACMLAGPAALFTRQTYPVFMSITLAALLIVFAHRTNIRQSILDSRQNRKAQNQP